MSTLLQLDGAQQRSPELGNLAGLTDFRKASETLLTENGHERNTNLGNCLTAF